MVTDGEALFPVESVPSDSLAVVAVHHVKFCFPACLRVTFHLAVSLIRDFLAGKPDSLGFTGETATPQPSTTAGTPNRSSTLNEGTFSV